MKRRTKRLVLPLFLSAVMIGSNVCYVCAQGQIADFSTGGDASAPGVEASVDTGVQENSATQPETAVQPETPTQTGQTTQPEDAAQTGQPEAGQTGQTTQPEAGQTGQTTQPEAGQTAQTEAGQTGQTTQPEDAAQTGQTTQTEGTEQSGQTTKDENGGDSSTTTVPGQSGGTEEDVDSETDVEDSDAEDDEKLPDDVAAADGTEEVPEEVFVNQNGEEVLPSTLVGVDYNTISATYDGATNVLKQYMISDTYAKDTVISCTVDENGNLVMTISLGASAADTATGMEERDSSLLESILGDGSTPAPEINGTFSGWDNIPVSYEYNWDNSSNCWEWGEWVTDPVTGQQTCYKTEAGTYDNDVRHEMQLYCDGDNVYLRITYATIYGSHANGEDFNFYFDRSDTGAKFQITYPENGGTLTNSTPGANVYRVDVRNGDTSNSYSIVDGAEAYYMVTENGINNQLELKIPLEALKAQLREKGIEVGDNFSVLEYTTPNLMYRRIATAGSPTGAEPFAAAVFLLVPTSYVCIKKKDKKEMAFA